MVGRYHSSNSLVFVGVIRIHAPALHVIGDAITEMRLRRCDYGDAITEMNCELRGLFGGLVNGCIRSGFMFVLVLVFAVGFRYNV